MPRIVRPAQRAAPVIAHVPHASTAIPPEVRAEIVLTDEELADELLRLTDWSTSRSRSAVTVATSSSPA